MQQIILTDKSELIAELRELIREELATLPQAPQQKKFLSLPEAARFLNFSRSTLYRMTSRNEIPHLKRGKLFFDEKQLIEWLNKETDVK